MKKLDWWRKDWFAALCVIVVIGLSINTTAIKAIDGKAYDMAMSMASKPASDKLAVIEIDEQSVRNLGRWPWSRDIFARITEVLAKGGARVVGNTVHFSEPQLDPGTQQVTEATRFLTSSSIAHSNDPNIQRDANELLGMLIAATTKFNSDQKFAAALGEAKNTVLGFSFELGPPAGAPQPKVDAYFPAQKLRNTAVSPEHPELADYKPFPARGVTIPLPALAEKSIGLGFLNVLPEKDGTFRRIPLVIDYFDTYYPSMALSLLAHGKGVGLGGTTVYFGEGVQVGNLRIRTDTDLSFLPRIYPNQNDKSPIIRDSFWDVYSGKISAEKYRDKIVLIGATAPDLAPSFTVPGGDLMAPVLFFAHGVSSLIQQDYVVEPSWNNYLMAALFALVSAYLLFLLPRLSAGLGATVTLVTTLVLVGGHMVILASGGPWIHVMWAVTLLLAGHAVLTTKRFLLTEQAQKSAAAASAESNRLLGLSFQQQGQLDMAWDKFRQIPLDESLLEVLYNLALDYERKRQFNKAANVFQHIASFDGGFRDVKQRLERSKQMEHTLIFGGTAAKSGSLLSGAVEKPMLGRYQIEKELGKGAMGVVYLGRDPKISRVVAIKTMELSSEFEPSELAEVKARFYREAETAGRLNHPNIVTIYDAGEERELAYIAMEFLKGKDMIPFTKADALLPLPRVVSIVARIADALAYAHANNVVHRDIKPANIMYEPEADQVKVTDFGVARITDASRTKTGMVLGTPSYMSPEQLAGRKIDGRSDLFSLGVMLYQLSCGQLPFQGDSLTELMYKIANEAAPDIRQFNPRLPECLVRIVNKSMAKAVEERYQDGTEMAADLRACAAASFGAAKPAAAQAK